MTVFHPKKTGKGSNLHADSKGCSGNSGSEIRAG